VDYLIGTNSSRSVTYSHARNICRLLNKIKILSTKSVRFRHVIRQPSRLKPLKNICSKSLHSNNVIYRQLRILRTNEVPQFVLQMRILNPKVFIDSFAPALKKLSHERSTNSQNSAQAADKLLKLLVKLKHLPQRILLEEISSQDDDVMIVDNNFEISIQLDENQAILQDLDQFINKKGKHLLIIYIFFFFNLFYYIIQSTKLLVKSLRMNLKIFRSWLIGSLMCCRNILQIYQGCISCAIHLLRTLLIFRCSKKN